ncbi:MAG: glycosyltransferase family 39 protein [Mesorhizobium sp.]
MTAMPISDRHLREWLWFVIALGAVLRFQGLGWDHGLILNPDERNIITAAARLSYPDHLVSDFSAYNGLALYLPRIFAALISPFTGVAGSDPAAIQFAGRILSALWSSLTLALLAHIAWRSFGLRIAFFVAICAGASPALIQSAHFLTTEAGLILCLSVLIALCQFYSRGKIPLLRFALLSGVVIGLGFGLKTTALVFALCPLAAVASTIRSRNQLVDAIIAGAAATAVVLVLALVTTPQLWATPGAYLDTMRFEGGVVRGTADVFWTYQFVGTVGGLFELSQLPWLLGPIVPALGLAGMMALVLDLRRGNRIALEYVPALGFAIVYGAIVCSWHAKFIRYLAPLLPVLILFSGYFISQLRVGTIRAGAMLATGLVTALAGLMQAAIYQKPDPRIAAWNWMVPRLTAGDGVAVEPADVGPPYWIPSATPVRTQMLPLLDVSSPGKIAKMAEVLAGSRWMIVASRRHYSVLPRLSGRFPEMCPYYAALWSGKLGYQLVATFRRRPSLPPVLDPTGQAEETFTVFDSPQVFIFEKTVPLAAPALVSAISDPASCAPRR